MGRVQPPLLPQGVPCTGLAPSVACLESAEGLPGGTLKFTASRFTAAPGHCEVMGPDSLGATLEQGEAFHPSIRGHRGGPRSDLK